MMVVIITQWIRRKLTGKATEEVKEEEGSPCNTLFVHSQLIISYLFRTEWVRFNSINRQNMRY